MSSARSDKIKNLLRISEHREREACNDYLRQRRETAQFDAQCAELERYREEYAKLIESKSRQGLSVAELSRWQTFLHQIDLAIEAQLQKRRDAEQALEASKIAWTGKRRRAKTIEDLVAKRVHDERVSKEIRQDNELDDRTQAQSFRRSGLRR